MAPDHEPSHRARRNRRERGAALVEIAIVIPILMTFLFGIIEFGWSFTQHLDVRHGARETARLTAVNLNPGNLDPSSQAWGIAALGCTRLEDASGVRIQIELDDTSQTEVGDLAIVTVTRDYEQLTGYLDPVFAGLDLESEIEFRLEQPASWQSMATAYTCP
ncbi:MAG: pilus assembly protein [Acidimicrobiia bacterium]|nr:pilus assembly protein [Acidimicrobiia bacterium]